MFYTSANSYMFSQLNKVAEIGIRLPKDRQNYFKEKYSTTGFKSYGSFIKDYVLVPKALLNDLKLIASYLQESYDYVMTLEPK